MNATNYRQSLPSQVYTSIRDNLFVLITMQTRLEIGRQTDKLFDGNGRYEADAINNYYGSPKGMRATAAAAWKTLNDWGSRCPEDVDFDALLEEIGGVLSLDSLEPSVDAEEYFNH